MTNLHSGFVPEADGSGLNRPMCAKCEHRIQRRADDGGPVYTPGCTSPGRSRSPRLTRDTRHRPRSGRATDRMSRHRRRGDNVLRIGGKCPTPPDESDPHSVGGHDVDPPDGIHLGRRRARSWLPSRGSAGDRRDACERHRRECDRSRVGERLPNDRQHHLQRDRVTMDTRVVHIDLACVVLGDELAAAEAESTARLTVE